MNIPKISVVIITYNRARFLSGAIESVLTQSVSDWEMIVIDDASTDNTGEVVEKYAASDERIRYYRNSKNLKISRSRNRGLELAQGKYVAVLDSDDVWCDKEKLAKQLAYLESHPNCGLVGGGIVVVDEEGREQRRYRNRETDESIRRGLLVKNQFAQSSVMYPRALVLGLGSYDVGLDGIEDYDLWLRIGHNSTLANLRDYVLCYRVHGSNISITDRARLMERNLLLIKRYRAYYPSYAYAWLRRTVRLCVYRMITSIKI